MLQHFKNPRQYRPTVIDRPDYADLIENGVGFEMDDQGRDWYDVREMFQENTFKVVYSQDGTVFQCEKDVNELCPHGMAGVVELEEVPDGLRRDTNNQYRFDGSKVVPNPLYYQALKEHLLKTAGEKISMYRDFEELGEDVSAILKEWRTYRLAVYNVDLSELDNIKWPEKPAE